MLVENKREKRGIRKPHAFGISSRSVVSSCHPSRIQLEHGTMTSQNTTCHWKQKERLQAVMRQVSFVPCIPLSNFQSLQCQQDPLHLSLSRHCQESVSKQPLSTPSQHPSSPAFLPRVSYRPSPDSQFVSQAVSRTKSKSWMPRKQEARSLRSQSRIGRSVHPTRSTRRTRTSRPDMRQAVTAARSSTS